MVLLVEEVTPKSVKNLRALYENDPGNYYFSSSRIYATESQEMNHAGPVIDTHLHVLKEQNFDRVTEARIGHTHPEDTPIESLVGWLKDAGVSEVFTPGSDLDSIVDYFKSGVNK